MVRRKNFIVLGLILTLVALIFFSGPASSAEKNVQTRGISDSEILLGTTTPLTGPVAPYSPVAKSIDVYFKWINDQGGIHGRKIKFLIEDDAYQTQQTVAKARKLVEQDQVFAMIGNLGSPCVMAIRDYLVEKQVPLVYPQSGVTALGTPPNKYRFTAYTSYQGEAAATVKYAVEELKHKKIAVVYVNNDAGIDGFNGAKPQMAKYGLSFAAEVAVEIGAIDLSPEALKLRKSGADFLMIQLSIKHVAAIINEMAKIGYKPQRYVWAPAAGSVRLFDMTGQNLDGVISSDYKETFDPKVPKHAKVLEILKKYNPKEKWEILGGHIANGWSVAEIAVEGLKRGGKDLTVDSFIAGMETMKAWKPTFISPVTFSPTRRQGQNSVRFSKADLKNRTFIPISDWVSAD